LLPKNFLIFVVYLSTSYIKAFEYIYFCIVNYVVFLFVVTVAHKSGAKIERFPGFTVQLLCFLGALRKLDSPST